jgi:hypothetical protein
MTRTFILLLLSALCLFADEPSWPGIEFSEVRAFSWPKAMNEEAVILKEMKPIDGALNPKGALISQEQTNRLITAITGKHPEYPMAMCHIPHNAFIFYDQRKKPVAFIEICFECSTHRIEPKGFADKIDLMAIASIFDSLKLTMGKYPDLASYKKSVDDLRKRMKESGFAE